MILPFAVVIPWVGLRAGRYVLTKDDTAVLPAPALASLDGGATEHAAAQRYRIALDPSAAEEVGISQRADNDR